MRILFLYPNTTRQKCPQLGICMISAVAKELGHEIALYDLTLIPKEEEFSSFRSMLANFKPDMLAVSCRSNEWPFLKQLFREVNTESLTKVFGGPHATVAPEEVITLADIVVIGEGEETFSELLEKIEKNQNYTNVLGCWVKRDGQIFRNPMRRLISDLDTLPIPNWKIFNDVHYYESYIKTSQRGVNVIGTFEKSRGCPYACSYCTNNYLRSLYKDGGIWRREKSPERIVKEMELFKKEYGLDFVYFVDEILLTRTDEIKRFRDLYRAKINVPFLFMERPENMRDEKVRLIREAGATNISIGIESGDEKLRRDLLNRHHSQETIISAFHTARKYGIKTHAFNMIGFPGQDKNSMAKSYQLLKKARPDTVQTTIFYPLKRTQLYDMMVQDGSLSPNAEMVTDYYKTDDMELIEFQFLLTYYYLPRFFLKIYLFVRNWNFLNKWFNIFLDLARKYRQGGLSFIGFILLNALKRKIRFFRKQ